MLIMGGGLELGIIRGGSVVRVVYALKKFGQKNKKISKRNIWFLI